MSTMPLYSDPKMENRNKYKRIANNVWWVVLAHGVIILIVGLFLLLQPALSVTLVAQIAGVYLIAINSISLMQWVLGMTRTRPSAQRALFFNVLGLMIGVIIALAPYIIAELLARFLFLFVGVGLVLYGIFHLIQASMARYVDNVSSRNFILGVVWVLVGLLVMIAPITATRIILVILGITAVGVGAALSYFSLYLRRLGNEIVRQIDVEVEREQIIIEQPPEVIPLRPES